MIEGCVGEFFGTMILVILGDGVVATALLNKSKGYEAGWLAITTGWFIAVVIGVFVAQSLGSPNADINPAISFSKFCLHQYSFSQTCIFTLSQISGAFIGAIIVWLAYLPHWQVTPDTDKKLMVFCTKPAIQVYPYNFLCEMIATAILIIGVAAIFAKTSPVAGLGPYLVGVLVWGIGLSLGGPTGYAINPARDFGPRLAHALLPIAGKGSSNWSYAWVPIFGPLLGGALAALLWSLIIS